MEDTAEAERGTPVVTETLERLFSAHRNRELDAARDLINRNGLIVWFHVDLHRLSQIVEDIVTAGSSRLDTTLAVHLFLTSPAQGRVADPLLLRALANSQLVNPVLLPAARMAEARLEGRLNDALEHSAELGDVSGCIQPFRDTQDPAFQFIALQRGITATLAGRLSDALLFFQEAQMRAIVPGLEFQLRDALARAALIQAAFGDAVEARVLLARAAEVPRTTSWAEATIDTSVELASILSDPDPAQAAASLAHLGLSDVGEMWPFFVHAQYRLLEDVGSNSLAARKVQALKGLPFPRVAGEGYSGSVFAIAEASNKILSGAPRQARHHLDEADRKFAPTAVLEALLETQVGSPLKAIDLALGIREHTFYLRRLEIWRISVLAEAHLMLGDHDQAVSVLRGTEAFPRPVTAAETEFFSQALRLLGKEHLPRWPRNPSTAAAYMDRLPQHVAQLTEREYEVLIALATGATRADIAARMFISLNTLKSQIRAIYRKLGAVSRDEALRVAAERGLI